MTKDAILTHARGIRGDDAREALATSVKCFKHRDQSKALSAALNRKIERRAHKIARQSNPVTAASLSVIEAKMERVECQVAALVKLNEELSDLVNLRLNERSSKTASDSDYASILSYPVE